MPKANAVGEVLKLLQAKLDDSKSIGTPEIGIVVKRMLDRQEELDAVFKKIWAVGGDELTEAEKEKSRVSLLDKIVGTAAQISSRPKEIRAARIELPKLLEKVGEGASHLAETLEQVYRHCELLDIECLPYVQDSLPILMLHAVPRCQNAQRTADFQSKAIESVTHLVGLGDCLPSLAEILRLLETTSKSSLDNAQESHGLKLKQKSHLANDFIRSLHYVLVFLGKTGHLACTEFTADDMTALAEVCLGLRGGSLDIPNTWRIMKLVREDTIKQIQKYDEDIEE